MDEAVEWVTTLDTVPVRIGDKVASANGVDIVLLPEVAGTLGPIDARAILIFLLLTSFSGVELDHLVEFAEVALLFSGGVNGSGCAQKTSDDKTVVFHFCENIKGSLIF